ncbi:MAG: FprA family A-type flavoprotein [Oscillospiraceae bacterium]|nr:FprA family A-type flavoprotein [Oscillospiraceae bacterium]
MNTKITDTIYYAGVDDKTIDLFESQYVVPNGVSYNSYVIMDEKITVMDTVDKRATDEWFSNIEKILDGKTPEYLVISHLEPDHAANIGLFAKKYPDTKLVGNAKTFAMLPQFFGDDFASRQVIVKEGDELCLGQHTLTFVMAPMVHWPEVMVAYDSKDKVLFSADGFGKFGALDTDEDWDCEARRYYFNIVGKYGAQVQALLKKAATLDIGIICPLHGPILTENLGHYIGKYDTWSKYEPENKGITVAYASIHGNTADAAKKFAEILKEQGEEKVSVFDLSRDDMAEAIEDAFRYDGIVFACATYDGGLFPCMEDYLSHLKSKTYRSRTAAIIENGSWGPMAAKHIRAALDEMKDITVIDKTVTIKSVMNESNITEMEEMAKELRKALGR